MNHSVKISVQVINSFKGITPNEVKATKFYVITDLRYLTAPVKYQLQTTLN